MLPGCEYRLAFKSSPLLFCSKGDVRCILARGGLLLNFLSLVQREKGIVRFLGIYCQVSDTDTNSKRVSGSTFFTCHKRSRKTKVFDVGPRCFIDYCKDSSLITRISKRYKLIKCAALQGYCKFPDFLVKDPFKF